MTEALTLYRELGERHGEAGACAERGAFRDPGLNYGEAITLTYPGSIQWKTGQLAEAEAEEMRLPGAEHLPRLRPRWRR